MEGGCRGLGRPRAEEAVTPEEVRKAQSDFNERLTAIHLVQCHGCKREIISCLGPMNEVTCAEGWPGGARYWCAKCRPAIVMRGEGEEWKA